MFISKLTNSNNLPKGDYFYTLNGKILKPNTIIPANSFIKKNYRLRGGSSYVDSVSDLTLALSSNPQSIQINKGTYASNFSFTSTSSDTLELIGGYTAQDTLDSNNTVEETVISGNLTISNSGNVTIKNLKVTGNIIVNGNVIELEKFNNTTFGKITGANIKFNVSNYEFNDMFFYGPGELLGNINVTTNGIHFTEKLTCSDFTINIQKTNDNTQPSEATLADPTDFYYADQYAINTAKISDAWKFCNFSTATEVIVAVLDTGVDLDHPDLINNFYKVNDEIVGKRFFNGSSSDDDFDDDNGHGTHVAGIIAADCDNNVGVAGVSRNDKIKIMPIKVLNQYSDGYYGYNNDISNGIRWAVDNGAHIINMSLGGSSSDSATSDSIKYAVDNGVLVVAAAGNSDNNAFVEYPGADTNALCVGAIEQDLDIATFSSYKVNNSYPTKPESHLGVDLVGPGVSIVSSYDDNTFYSDTYRTLSGTSMATPLVAGIAALLMQQCPNYLGKPEIIRTVLLQSSSDLGATGYDDKFGYGMVDTKTALLFPWSSTFYDSDNSSQITTAADYSFTRLTQATTNTLYETPSSNEGSGGGGSTGKKSKKGLGLLLGLAAATLVALGSMETRDDEESESKN